MATSSLADLSRTPIGNICALPLKIANIGGKLVVLRSPSIAVMTMPSKTPKTNANRAAREPKMTVSVLQHRLTQLTRDARRLTRNNDSPVEVLQLLIDPLPVAAIVANDAGHFVVTNPAAASLTGYSPAELQRLSMWQVTPNTLDHEAEVLWRAFISTREQSGEYRVLTKDRRIITTTYAAAANVLPGYHVSLLATPRA